MFDRLSIHASRSLATAMGAALCALALQAQASTPSGMVPPASEASGMVQQFAQDVVRSADAEGRTFGVIDKPSATLWIFDAQGRPVASVLFELGGDLLHWGGEVGGDGDLNFVRVGKTGDGHGQPEKNGFFQHFFPFRREGRG